MLDLPKSILHLFSPIKLHRRPGDLEKDGENNLQKVEEGNLAFLDDSDNVDSTPTYRLLPIFSGIMIPFSIMLSIPSLTGHWYIRTGENGVLLETRPNPPLLDAAMSLSMGCGIIASTCLVVRFAERRIKLMTMLCIIFLTFHDLINIPAVTIFGVEHRFEDGFTYGQSFWFTVCSTIASTATNITLITDFYRTTNFNHAGSGLTHTQRSLVIIIIVLLGYISLGSLLLAIMLKIAFIDALYFSVVSIETIGFGDLRPDSTGTRIFTCFYIAGGMLNLALAVALSRDALLEAATVGFRARLKAAEVRQRERHIRTRWRAAVRWRLRAGGYPVWIDDREEERKERVGLRRHHHWYSWLRLLWRRLSDEVWREWEDPAWKYVYGPRHKRLNLEVLTETQLETAALEAGAPLSELVPKGLKLQGSWLLDGEAVQDASGNVTSPTPWFPTFETGNNVPPPSLTHMRMGGMVSLLGKFAIAMTFGFQPEPQNALNLEDDGDDTVQGIYDDSYTPPRAGHGVPFTRTMTMTTVQEDDPPLSESLEMEERHAFRARLATASTLFIVFWLAGSAIFMRTENWAFGSAVYFCFISFTTVGYGDFTPTTAAGRSIFVVWALVGVGTLTILISILAEAYSTQYKSVIKSEISSALEDPNAMRQPMYDSRAIIDFGEDPDPDPYRSSPAIGDASSGALATSSSTTRFGRSRGPTMASIAELQLTAGNAQPRRINEQLEALPHQVLEYAEALRCLLATAIPDAKGSEDGNVNNLPPEISRREKMEILLSEIEKSLQDITNAAQDALDKTDP